MIDRAWLFSACLLGLLVLLPSAVYSAEEKMVWDICQKIEANTEDFSEVIADCEEFMNGRQTDQLAPVVKGVLAWCYFKEDRMPDGAKLLIPMSQKRYTAMQKAGSDMARTWLSRIDVLTVKMALKIYYNKHQKFPEKLKEAVDFAEASRYKLKAPKTDRWDKPWEYELVGFKMLKSVPKNQKYSLKSVLLGDYMDFEEALKLPFGEAIDLVPMKMGSTARGAESVYFHKAADKNKTPVLMKVGDRRMGITLGFVGKKTIVLTDGNHWKMVSRPLR